MTLVILYEELAAYFVKCISVFAQEYHADVHIIRKEVNKEAPFQLDLSGLKIYNRADYTSVELAALVKKINPGAILCGGWSNKAYLEIVAAYKNKIPTIVGFDNKWTGSLKQRLASLAAPFYITGKFNACFVPGPEQKKFALKMGFKESKIATGAYSCDFDLFHTQYLKNKEEKQAHFPKRFIYAGRYVEHKGIKDLWNAFITLQREMPNDWELWCLGAGDVEAVQHPKIKHFGFVQPAALLPYIKDTGVFVLPSHFEPWGVVVHEFAAAGFPLICSSEVGAATAFVQNDFNGYIYKAGDVSALKEALKTVIRAEQQQLLKMSDNSVLKAQKNTPAIWAKQLASLIYEK